MNASGEDEGGLDPYAVSAVVFSVLILAALLLLGQ